MLQAIKSAKGAVGAVDEGGETVFKDMIANTITYLGPGADPIRCEMAAAK